MIRRSDSAETVATLGFLECGTLSRQSERAWNAKKTLEGMAIVLGIIGAEYAVLQAFHFEIVRGDDHIGRQALAENPEEYGYVRKVDCVKPPAFPEIGVPASQPAGATEKSGKTEAEKSVQDLDEMIQEGNAIREHVDGIERLGRDTFFERFDRWRTDSRARLQAADGVIKSLGLPNSEVHWDSFYAVTHIKRDLEKEPYTHDEYRSFLKEGTEVLTRVRDFLQERASPPQPADSVQEPALR